MINDDNCLLHAICSVSYWAALGFVIAHGITAHIHTLTIAVCLLIVGGIAHYGLTIKDG